MTNNAASSDCGFGIFGAIQRLERLVAKILHFLGSVGKSVPSCGEQEGDLRSCWYAGILRGSGNQRSA